ncbi:hypothetical protein [Paraflavitalea speifideaquila]|uniref:hypothetical protein n=1 Tax=Paraflavitalea speifideaquila TaxID=3076558 RepID=UPI0028EA6FE9|nr:hypothetical protein [Paraflavitalea speifideiaquila]
MGPAFRIGSGHETKYFYGKPTQVELDRLFGSEAGNASRYLKNMVVDPNGQISVSYMNAGGKTIATALAGATPPNVQGLPSNGAGASTRVTADLIKPDDFLKSTEDYSLSANATFMAPITGDYTLHYRLDPVRLQVLHGPGDNSIICNNCYYDLEIVVKDDCGNTLKTATRAAGMVFDTTCANIPAVITDSLVIEVPAIGEYYVSYQLKISEDALNFYDNVHIVKIPTLRSSITFCWMS